MIWAQVEVKCTPAEVVERIYREFGVESYGVGKHELRAPFKKLGLPAVGSLSRTALVALGESEARAGDGATMIPIQWCDLESDVFPVFRGAIEVTILDRRLVQVAIIGSYEPTLWPLGAMFDAALGKTIARASVDQLLSCIRASIENTPSRPADARLQKSHLAGP